jgi:SapC
LIDPILFPQPIALDRAKHGKARLKPQTLRTDRARAMNAMFVAAVEFIDVAREYPIVFVEAGTGPEGQREVAPMAVLGLTQGENLMIEPDGGWAARYVPALLRGYPLGMAQTDAGGFVVVIDGQADALSDTEGERIFDDLGQPTPMIEQRKAFLEQFENEAQRTRLVGRALLDNDLLTTMRFDATLPDGQTLTVDGFLAVDEKKFAELPDAKVVELHKSGLLGLVHAHLFSLGLMRALAERRFARLPATA